MKNCLPAFMSLLLVAGILAVVFLRSFYQREFSPLLFLQPVPVLGLTYVLWMLLELRITVTEPEKGSTKSDKMTLELYALAQAATLLSALWFGPGRFCALFAIGFAIFLAGVSFRLSAITALGRYYSHMVRIQRDHRIVDTGPYRFLRHPAYAGMLAAHVGVLLACRNPITLAIFGLGLIPAILLRIRNEEQILYSVPGYQDFAKTRKRLLPMLW